MKKKVVVIGGGTGTFVVLSGIKKYPLDISAIVSIMDSGGSTGRLRDQYGVVPPGDVRQCLVALSEASELWRKLFLYRFENGDFVGHNFGNIFLTALEKNAQDYQEVIDTASYILQTKGTVIPVTFDKVHLCVKYEDGEIIETEELIDTAFHKTSRIQDIFLKPSARANKAGLSAIHGADFLILGPGDLYTSLIPNLVVSGLKESIVTSSAKIVVIVNLMTKRGQTTNYTASDHIRDLEKYLGRNVDFVIINNTSIPPEVNAFYAKHGEKEVLDDLEAYKQQTNARFETIRADLVSHSMYNQSLVDSVPRSLLRHDSKKVARVIREVVHV